MPQYFGQLPTHRIPWQTPKALQSWQRHGQGIVAECDGALLRVSVLAADLVRVRLAPQGNWAAERSWTVIRPDRDWPEVAFAVTESASALGIETEKLRLEIAREPLRLQFFDREGRPFACDVEPGMAWQPGIVSAAKRIEANEHYYGFGERTGLLDKLAERLTNWTTDAIDYDALTDSMYQAIPFFIALRPGVGYGLFFHTTYFSQFDIGAQTPGTWLMQTRGPELDYYVIYGPTPAQILERYSELTGRMAMPPRWALGYHQCRWSYASADEVRELAQEFRSRQLPCDVIHLDIDYMRGYRVFTWSPARFGEPARLMTDLAAEGFRTVAIVDPGVKYEPEAGYAVFDEGMDKDCFVRTADGQLFYGYVWPDKALLPDMMSSRVRAWWSNWHRVLTDAGVAGIWTDMNEPTMDDRPFGDQGQKIVPPPGSPQGDPEERATHAETHNLYGQMMARAAAEALAAQRPGERPFVLTRAGFAGIQRYAAVWTGDNQSLWEHLEMSLPMLCNLSLSGVPFVGADIGGFAGNATGELFARWMQVGMLYPLMRGHSALGTGRHEPWVFGERIERICREYLELRYRLLPYLYTLFWQAASRGEPIIRPLVYHWPDDERTYALHDQVMLGPSLLAAPIYRPGIEYRAVYLPAGTWYDWWSGASYAGPTHILAHAPLERLPLYVPSGAIIPMQAVCQHTDAGVGGDLHWRVWPGHGQWTLYEDNGRAGPSATVNCQVEGTLVSFAARVGDWRPTPRNWRVELVGAGVQELVDDGEAHRLLFV